MINSVSRVLYSNPYLVERLIASLGPKPAEQSQEIYLHRRVVKDGIS